VPSLLLPLAYTVPVLFGLGVYLWLRERPEPVEATAISWAIGWASICAIELTADHLVGVRLDAGFFLGVTLALAALPSIILIIRRERLVGMLKGLSLPSDLRSREGFAYLALITSFIAFVFYKAVITPPDSTDALVYHMELPKLAFETGQFPATPGVGWTEIVTAWSGLIETQQLWIYLGSSQVNEFLVRPIMPVYSALLLLIVFRDVRRSYGIPAAGLAATCLFSLNEFASLSTVLWAEVPVAFYSYLAVRPYLEAPIRSPSKIALGALAGMAALVKYDWLALLLALAVAYFALPFLETNSIARLRGTQRARRGARNFAVVVAAGLAVASPLLLRNALIFGNPVYPFLIGGTNTEQIGYYGADYSLNDYARFRIHESIILLGSIVGAAIVMGVLRWRSWSRYEKFVLAVLLLYMPLFLYAPLAGSHIRYLAPVLPLGAVLAGRNLSWWFTESELAQRRRGALVILALAGIVTGLLWVSDAKPAYLIQYVATFLILSFALLLASMALALRRMKRFAVPVTFIIAAALLVPGVLAVAADKYPPREVAWDFSILPPDPVVFLEQRLGNDWRMWQWINQNTPRDAILLTFEARLFYLDREVVFGADHILLPTYSMSLNDAVSYVRGLNVTYVLDSPWSHVPEVNRIFLNRSPLFQNLGDQTYFTVVHTEGEVRLYSFTP